MALTISPLTVQAQVPVQTTAPALPATQPPVLLLQATTQEATLAGHTAVWVDTQANMTLSNARQQPFTTISHFQSAGFTKAAYWFQLRVARAPDAPTRWLLAMGEPYLDDIQVWTERDGDAERATDSTPPLRLGDHVPFAERPLRTRAPTVRLYLPDTQPLTVWVRVSSINAMNFNAIVWQSDALIANETRFNFYQGGYFGVLIVVMLIYGLLGTWLRDTGMLSYAAYVGTLMLLYLGINGHAQVIFPWASAFTWANDALVGCGVMGGLVVMPLLWDQLLNMRTQFPLMHRVYQGISLGVALLLPSAFTPYYRLTGALVTQVGIFFALLSLGLVVVALYRKRSTPLLLYLLAFVATVIGNIVYITGVLGWIKPTSFTANAYQTASLVHIMVMNVGLAMRVRQLQRNEVLAEQRATLATERTTEHKRFIAMLSHEFRNPLASIDRATNLLQLKLTALADADEARLSGIRSNVTKLSTLVDSFLISEAVEEQLLSPVPRNQAVAPLLASVIAAQGSDLQRQVTLVVIPLDLRFSFDARMIDIAVNNLLGNALRYTNDGQVTLEAQLDGRDLLITVADQGPGLVKNELKQLGQPYYQASTAASKQGTGLGYYFSRLIVEAHGGQLSAANRTPRGLLVTLRLPQARPNYQGTGVPLSQMQLQKR